MVRFLVHSALALLLAAVAPGVDAYRPGDEICTYASSSSSCALGSITPSKTDGSVLIYPGGKTRCAFDDFSDPVTGFVSNATYFFQVFPKPEKKKLLLMLQGGGACIDKQTCDFALQCSMPAQLLSTKASASSTGVLNANDPKNPFQDWNVVYIPYCTGDLHIGNKVLDAYESGLEAIFGRPQCMGQNKKTYFNGYENMQSALKWAKANYPQVDELVLSGMSAGSLGAQVLTAHVGNMWEVTKTNTRYGILMDSYIGVVPASRTAGSIVNYYGGCDVELDVPASLIAACKAETASLVDLNTEMIKEFPKSDWLFVNSNGDNTQRLFYQLAKDGIAGYPFTNMISADDYLVEVNKIIGAYQKATDHVSTFFVNSTSHVYFNKDDFYNTVDVDGNVLGSTLKTWIANVGTGVVNTPKPTTVSPSPTTVAPGPTTDRPAC